MYTFDSIKQVTRMDEIVKVIASLGLPGVILIVTMATTAYPVTTAIPFALAVLGGPFGMFGGLTVLGLTTLVSEALAGYGIEKLLSYVYAERSKNESLAGILKEINGLPISDDLKQKLKDTLPKKEDVDSDAYFPQVKEID